MPYPQLALFIDGKWLADRDGEGVVNPATGQEIARLPHATRDDLDTAIAAAARGFELWSRTAPERREEVLLRAADLLLERTNAIAEALTLDQGKTWDEAVTEVKIAAARIRWDAGEARRIYGRIVPTGGPLRKFVTRHPMGVVAAFTPWNYPLASPTRKVAGALAAGCSIILKAAEETPAGAVELVRAFADAGVPDGVVNLVFGKPADISAYLIPSPVVRVVTFTGSVPVGKHLAALCGTHMKPAIMELGGNSPVIVWDDVDADAVARLSAIGKSRNAGQVCVSPTRFFVHTAQYDRFVERFGEAARTMSVGPASDPSAQMGPLANPRRVAAVEGYVADALERGARLMSGGQRVGNEGYFYPMTVLADVPDDALAMREEPFGPLALVQRVSTLDEAIAKANSVEFGLAAYAFTDRASVVAELSERIACGSLSINHYTSSFPDIPFGGIKDSGYGREGGSEGLDGYTFTRATTQLPPVRA